MPGASDGSADWRATYLDLRARIDGGEVAAGRDLPTIAALAEQTGLGRYGARRVLERLREDGRAQSWQGRGYRVTERRVTYRVGGPPRFTHAMQAMGLSVSTDFTSVGRRRMPSDLPPGVGLSPRALVHRAEMVRAVNGRPIAILRVHFPLERFEGILDRLAATCSVTDALATMGVADFVRRNTTLEARLPTASEAVLLGIVRSQPVIVTTGVGVDATDTSCVVEINRTVWRADCVTLIV